jgi:hypothetical protein
MRKYVLLSVWFLICGSFLFAELNKAQMWAISLTGILSEVNESNRNSLNESGMDERGKGTWLTVLKRDWEITTREELLKQISDLENEGHTASLSEIKKIINELAEINNAADLGIFFTINELTQTKINRLKYVSNNWEQYQNRTIRAWDLARCISLCRWGYNVGFITEEEAWGKILPVAKLLQSQYNSWEEFGYDYLIGRLFWASGFGQEKAYFTRTEPIYRRLLDSYWKWLDWNIDLDLPETNQTPINTIRFLKPNDDDGMFQFQTNDPSLYDRWQYNYMQNPGLEKNIYEVLVKKKSGHNGYGFGILFCVDDSDSSNAGFYRFFISVDGTYSITKYVGKNQVAVPISWKFSPFLKTGYNVYNKIRVTRIDNGSFAKFYITFNDNLAATFDDDNPINGNKIGLLASVNIMVKEQFPYIPVDVRFDLPNNNTETLVFMNKINLYGN